MSYFFKANISYQFEWWAPTGKEGVDLLSESPFSFYIIMGARKQETKHMGVRAKWEMLPKGERYDMTSWGQINQIWWGSSGRLCRRAWAVHKLSRENSWVCRRWWARVDIGKESRLKQDASRYKPGPWRDPSKECEGFFFKYNLYKSNITSILKSKNGGIITCSKAR